MSQDNLKYDSYRYYVCGLKIGETNYTVKITVGVKGGSKYYDHALTEIEKGSLLDNIDALSTTFDAKETSKGFGSTPGTNPTTLAISKDSKLLSILQNNSSKVVDENGEPRVVYHGTPNDFTVFDKDYLQTTSGDKGNFGSGFYFTPRATVADFYARFKGGNGFVIDGFLNLMNPFVIEDHSYEEILRYIREDYSRELADGMSRIEDRSSQASVMIIDSHSEETFSKNLSEAGYDGIIARRGEQIIAFDSNQIKSATDNVGTFDTENDDIRYQLFGGNSGYVGYSMSRRAAQAREDGKFPKTDFKKEYKVKEDSLKALVDAKVIDDSEWHHTSMYGNRTTFYQWDEPEYADIYAENKKEIDAMIANKEKDLKSKIANLQEQLDAMPKERPYRYEMESDEFRNAKRRIERETSAKTQEINDSYPYNETKEQRAERISRLEAAWAEREARIKELEENASESDKVIIAHSKANDEYYRKSGKLIAAIQDARRDHDDDFRKKLSDYFISRYEAIEAQRKAEAEAKAKLDAMNEQFNGKLDSLIADPTQKDRVLSLGQPGNFLVRGGIADAEIRLDYDKLVRKSKESYKNAHPFDSSDVKNLPRAINAPIAVFNNTNDLDAGQVILTEIKRGDHNFIVAVQTKQEHRKGGSDYRSK